MAADSRTSSSGSVPAVDFWSGLRDEHPQHRRVDRRTDSRTPPPTRALPEQQRLLRRRASGVSIRSRPSSRPKAGVTTPGAVGSGSATRPS